MKFKIIGLLLLAVALLASTGLARAEDKAIRIEQEDKLLVPQEKTAAVWQWLQQTYIENQAVSLLDPKITARGSEEKFTDTYYDTPQLKLLDHKNSVRHRKRENLTDPADRKSDQELIQIKINGVGDNQFTRGEYKFEVDLANNYLSDLHPLLSIMKKKQRNEFTNRLKELEIPVNSLRPVLVLNDLRKRIYFEKEAVPFISISLDQATATRWWVKTEFTEVESELNEVTYTASDEAARKYMEEINHQIINQLKQQFPEIHSDLTPKYNKAFLGIELKLPFWRWLIKWKLI